MAPIFHFPLVLFTLGLLFSPEIRSTQAPFKPTALFFQVLKDKTTNLHIINIRKRTPLKSISFLVDLNGRFLSVNCEQDYLSSTYNAPVCHSTQCSLVGGHFCHKCSSQAQPGCHNNTCAITTTNPLTHQNVVGELAQDNIEIQTLHCSNPGPLVVLSHFLFACTPSSFLQGPLTCNVHGIAGFNHDPVSLPRQLASHFGFPPKFALCLTSKSNENGVIFFGNADYRYEPTKDVSLQYTPLEIGSQGEYFIPVKSIKIEGKEIQFNTSLFSKTRSFGGTMITTATPYTTLEHSVFQAVTQVYAKEYIAMGASQTSPVSPFGVCFNQTPPPGPEWREQAPTIEFVMQNRNTTWRFESFSSIIYAKPGIWCLAFVDGGSKPRASVVLGSYQLEDHILEFDLDRSRLGFSNSLMYDHYVSCSQYNYNSTV